VGTLRSLGEGGCASEGSARRSVWRGATAVRPWGSTWCRNLAKGMSLGVGCPAGVCLSAKIVVIFRLTVILLPSRRSCDTDMDNPIVKSQSAPDALLAESVVLTRLDKAVGWARKYSLFPYPFATACCAMEYMSLSMSPYDIDRFGALLPRFSPRQADLLMVIGTVNHKLSPVLKRVYEQMCEPRWVMAFGACAASGGFYDNYATVQGIDRIIPVDVYVPGCPPRPEAVLDGLMQLQGRIATQKHPL